jgi:LmbE family N-acetylglucosaminyl deacetylase
MRIHAACRGGLATVVAAALAGPPVSLALACAAAGVRAQSLDGAGVVATGLLLRQMHGVKRVLMIGAHPDDEDTDLLTTLARGLGAETAYLSLTRGDGGQNLIGPELWEGLAVIRTGELVAARSLDGGRQFFTRAFDYGYSKSAEEAFELWPREELLADVVWVVRSFRPHVIVSVFSGTPSDGHGQHQAAGIMAREAFDAAADPGRFPEQLARGVDAWAPAKLYRSSRRRFSGGDVADDGAVTVETGHMDPLLGRSPFQLAMQSRSQHRSQDMGSGQPPGPRATAVLLVDSRVDSTGEGIFAGIDTTFAGLTEPLPEGAARSVRAHLEAYEAAVRRATERFGLDPSGIAPDLAEALGHLSLAEAAAGPASREELIATLERKRQVVSRAVMAASGVTFDVRADDDVLVPGDTVRVRAQLWNGGAHVVRRPAVELDAPGWAVDRVGVEGVTASEDVAPGALAEWTFDVRVPDDAELSRLYYLREAREGALYRWPEDHLLWGLPRDPAPVTGRAELALAGDFAPRGERAPSGERALTGDGVAAGARVVAAAPWRYVGVDPARGEYEEPVLVLPAVSVRVLPDGLAWPRSRSEAREISVVVGSEVEGGASGEVAVRAPDGWAVVPESRRFDLAGAGTERSMTFEIRPTESVAVGEHVFRVLARTDDGREYDEGRTLIDYEHIERAALFRPAEARVTVVPVAVTEGLRVGYIMGSGDDGPEAIRQMGATVEVLDEDRVRDGAFDGFHTIVLGVRAYETRPDLQAASGQLLDFARSGGTVLAQYNRGPLGRLAPYSLDVGRGSPRVADETAPVRIIAPAAPVFTTPNEITAEDFRGWVQERGLYFGAEWDDRYVPLLEMSDPGEEPRRGSLLVAPVGDGVFVYAALSFFRQWSERVPGAYRLFANLISLDAAAWRGYAAVR